MGPRALNIRVCYFVNCPWITKYNGDKCVWCTSAGRMDLHWFKNKASEPAENCNDKGLNFMMNISPTFIPFTA